MLEIRLQILELAEYSIPLCKDELFLLKQAKSSGNPLL
jgi:hypothetical protein